jgi:retron-type reverse transcriptase
MNQSPLFKLRSKGRLASLLGMSEKELLELATLADSLYSMFEIPKKNGGVRGVENPRRQLKLVQATVARLLGRIQPPDYLFCPVKGRCYVTNAAQHRGQRVIRCLDIKKYFPSTPSRKVFYFFHKVMQCEKDIAATLASLACHKGHLPTGSPLSPIMAHYAHYDLWQAEATQCREHGYRLTVYIDDVTISGQSVSRDVMWAIKRAIHGAGLKYHKEKHFVDRPAEVTGVIISGDSLKVPNRQLKKLNEARAALRHPDASVLDPKLRERMLGLQGQVAQVAAIRARIGRELV